MNTLPPRVHVPSPRPRFLSRRDTEVLLDAVSRVAARGETPSGASVAESVAAAMEEIGVHAALVHGFRVTGMLVSEENHDLWSREELARWDAAVASYFVARRASSLSTAF